MSNIVGEYVLDEDGLWCLLKLMQNKQGFNFPYNKESLENKLFVEKFDVYQDEKYLNSNGYITISNDGTSRESGPKFAKGNNKAGHYKALFTNTTSDTYLILDFPDDITRENIWVFNDDLLRKVELRRHSGYNDIYQLLLYMDKDSTYLFDIKLCYNNMKLLLIEVQKYE